MAFTIKDASASGNTEEMKLGMNAVEWHQSTEMALLHKMMQSVIETNQ